MCTNAKEVAARLELGGTDPDRKALDALKQLVKKGLVQKRQIPATRDRGVSWEFFPATVTLDQQNPRDRNRVTVVKSDRDDEPDSIEEILESQPPRDYSSFFSPDPYVEQLQGPKPLSLDDLLYPDMH